MASSRLRKFNLDSLRTAFRYLCETCVWATLAFGCVPGEIFTYRDTNKPHGDHEVPLAEAAAPTAVAELIEAPAPLSPAEQRQWADFVRKIETT